MHAGKTRVAGPDSKRFGNLDPDPHRSKNSGAVKKMEPRRAVDAHNGSEWSRKPEVKYLYHFDEEQDLDPH
jgi:hypothetical protein